MPRNLHARRDRERSHHLRRDDAASGLSAVEGRVARSARDRGRVQACRDPCARVETAVGLAAFLLECSKRRAGGPQFD